MNSQATKDPTIEIGPATALELGGLKTLLGLRWPSYWMKKVPDSSLDAFLQYAVDSARSVILLARAAGDRLPAGYVFATLDPRWFWTGFAVRNPLTTHAIVAARLMRRLELKRRRQRLQKQGDGASGLPDFSWTPSAPSVARVLGLYVRQEHRRKGVAMALYFELFEALKAKGVSRVEEYMGPDYPQYAGKFPQTCGWSLQKCSSGGYKISKEL